MKHTKKLARVQRKQSAFHSDRTIQEALTKHPGSFHNPGSLKKT